MSKNPLLLLLLVFSLFAVSAFGQKLKPLDPMLSDVKYPFPVRTMPLQVQKQSLNMAYMDLKPKKANGKTVLLIHGKNFNGAYWAQTANRLAAGGYRVIMPDQIGFGKSSKPENFQYSFQQLAENTLRILDTLGIDKFVVLGHSMGGMLASRMAIDYPNRVEKLILENPIGLEDYREFSPYQDLNAQYAGELKKTYDDYKKYQLTFYYDNKWKQDYDTWLNMLAGWTLHPDYPVIAWNAALTSDMIFTQPVVHDLHRIKCPTLLIIGTRDRTAIGKDKAPEELKPLMGLYNKLGKTTQERIKGSELVELDNVGHMPHIEVFEKFIKPVLSFLKK